MTELSLVERIAGIDAGEWDELADGNVLASHAYLRLVEETSLAGPQCRYLIIREDSIPKAALIWRVERPANGRMSLEDILFGRLNWLPRRLGASMLPAMTCGGLLSWHPGVLFRAGLSDAGRARLFEALLARLEHEAERAGCAIYFGNMPAAKSSISDVLLSRGYIRSPELPVCCLDIEWDSFDGYLRGLRKHHPSTAQNIRTELNGGRRAGVVISPVENPAPISDQLHRLMEAHHHRLNDRSFPYRPEFFQKLKAYLDGRAVVYTATLRERIVAALVMFRGKGIASVPMIGIDDGFVRKHHLYFNLAFNRPIEDAIQAGMTRLYFGRMIYGTKLRRGCRLANTDLFFRARNGISHAVLRLLLAVRARRVKGMMAGVAHRS